MRRFGVKLCRTEAAVLLAALAIRLCIAWAPMDWLVRVVLGDDPFYYFTIARGFGRGHGFSFDGVEPTNGFHPLWLLCLLPIFELVADPALAIHAALTACALCDAIALLCLLRLFRELGVRRAVSVAVAILYAASPLLLSPRGAMNGLETALNLALTIVFLTVYGRAVTGAAGPAAAVWLGVSSGLLFLARTDNAVLLAFAHAYVFWTRRRDRARTRQAVGSVLVAGAVVAPWLVWSWVRFGSPVQVSGLSVARFTRDLVAAQGWTIADHATKALRNLATVATYFPVYHLNARSFTAAAAGNAVILLGLAVVLLRLYLTDAPENRRVFRGRIGPWVPPLVAGGVFVVIHTARSIELRGWYYASLLPALYIVLAIVAHDVVSRLLLASRRVRRFSLAAGASVFALVLGLSLGSALSPRCGEIDGYRMIRAVNDTLPTGTLLGSWNAGLFGYFYERGHVVNLDGLVNNGAYDAMTRRSTGAYVSRRNIRYLLDAAGAMELWKPYWNATGSVTFPPPLLDNAATAECRAIRLIPAP